MASFERLHECANLRCDLGIARQWKDDPRSAIGACPQPALIDKDDILDRLVESRGIRDAAWRRMSFARSAALWNFSRDDLGIARPGRGAVDLAPTARVLSLATDTL